MLEVKHIFGIGSDFSSLSCWAVMLNYIVYYYLHIQQWIYNWMINV